MIELNGLYDVYKIRRTAGNTGASMRRMETEQAADPFRQVGGDVIQISPDASLRAGVAGLAKAAAARAEQGVSPERMAYLKNAYSGENCPVSPEDTARAMFARLCDAQDK